MNDTGRSAFIVGAGIFLSRITGLLRTTVIAHYLGASAASDAYNIAVRIPNTVRNLLGEGTLSASFVPVYTRLLNRNDPRAARAMSMAVLGILMFVTAALTVLGIALAPQLTALLASGLDPQRSALAARLMRVLFPMTGLMVLSGWCLGVQNSHKRFFWAYASAALWSIAQIVLLIGWGGHAETQAQLAWWLAWATLVGALLQVLAQLPEVLRLVGPLRPTLDRTIEGVLPVIRNLGPVIAALGVVQISSLVDLQIASYLPEGAIAHLGFASLIALLPVSLFGVSVAAASLPDFSRDSGAEALDALRERLRAGWQRILFYIIPCVIVFIAYGDYCNGLLYRTGEFTAADQRIVHFVLAGYAVGLVSFASVKLLASAHYALQDYRIPLRASITSVIVSAITATAFAVPMRTSPYAAAAIALGSAVGSYANLTVLMRGLRARLGPIYTTNMWVGTRRIVVAALVAGVVAWPLRMLLQGRHPMLAGPPILATYGLTYLVVAWFMGSGEASRWLRLSPRGARQDAG